MEQAIQLLLKFLTDNNLHGRKRQVEHAVATGRVVSTTGDDVVDGVSVTFLAAPRMALVAIIPPGHTPPGPPTDPFVQAEGAVNLVTICTPSSSSTMPVTTEEGLLVTDRAYQYVILTPEEILSLPGSASFIPAMEKKASDKAKEQGKPPETPGEGPPETQALPPVP